MDRFYLYVSSDEDEEEEEEHVDSKRKKPSPEKEKEVLSTLVSIPTTKGNIILDRARMTHIQKKCDQLKGEIELKTLENHLLYVDKELEIKRKKELLKMEDELEQNEMQMKKRKIQSQYDYVQSKINLKNKEKELKTYTEKDPEYLENPVREVDGEIEIVISDRVIELSGVIVYDTGEYITSKIEFYNNKSNYPIFLIIDHSPGGSVSTGFGILKAMESSRSPIYVIVKSFAASMAATIATLAEHSYIYPNAIMLHHQIWTRTYGNLTQQREQVEELEEWWKRLATPIVKKLGLRSIEEWIKLMYKNNSDGDWSLFGDKAYKQGWVTGVVNRVIDTGISRNKEIKTCDDKCCKIQNLPPLKEKDCYWIYREKF
jgi:ATP-dependent Clp protease protease subunit